MSLIVLFRNRAVGTIDLNPDSRMEFRYVSEWAESSSSFPISASLPLSGDYSAGRDDHRFFGNLLPEAAARESICRSLGISRDNDYELLAATGGECAGALQIVPEDQSLPLESGYEPISEETLNKAVQSHIPYTRLASSGKLRLSLAGAQDKWPVLSRGGGLFWPIGDAPSSHILKFANRDFPGLNWNEAYTTFLAGRLGIPTIDVAPGSGYSLTSRYDRIADDEGRIERVHQEDFCQALGYSFITKYESEGGPGLAECADLVRRITISPAEELLNLIRWQILNLLLGNSDGHAKNLSILYAAEGPRLAPFYDLVCTRIYPGITSNVALSVGGSFDPGHTRRDDWSRMAAEIQVSPRLIFRILEGFIHAVEAKLDEFHRLFVAEHGSNAVLDRIDIAVRKQVRRTRTLLKG